jgi:hypothetical protein
MCWSRKGVSGLKRSGEAETPFLKASLRAKSKGRAGSSLFISGVRLIDVHPDEHSWSNGIDRSTYPTIFRGYLQLRASVGLTPGVASYFQADDPVPLIVLGSQSRSLAA